MSDATETIPDGAEFLADIGRNVREMRSQAGITRRALADRSGVSERYIAKVEGGAGNPSISVLRRLAEVMACPLGALIGDGTVAAGTSPALHRMLGRLGPEDLRIVEDFLRRRFPTPAASGRGKRISLVGLRGAGKSTLGQRLADDLGYPFVELDRVIERDYGTNIGEILTLSGPPAYRRYERRCLDAVLDAHAQVVVATGGGIVAEAETYAQLLQRSHCIWLLADPEDHMDRVIAQGDFRPMAQNSDAMDDLRAILTARRPFYEMAERTVDTRGETEDRSFKALQTIARALLDS